VILAAVPSAEVLVLVVDVRDASSAERAVQALLARFGRLDILVANAGAISPFDQSTCQAQVAAACFCCLFCSERRRMAAMHQKDPEVWWNTFEVNIRGAFNFFRCEFLFGPRSWSKLTFVPFS
jgi:NAD(P)-dependent dehydrogenase (short-subunit alcohol dehydrogenase family)